MKKWIDASKIAEKSEVSWDLVKYESLMKEKPNFNKAKENIKRERSEKMKRYGKSKKTFKAD